MTGNENLDFILFSIFVDWTCRRISPALLEALTREPYRAVTGAGMKYPPPFLLWHAEASNSTAIERSTYLARIC